MLAQFFFQEVRPNFLRVLSVPAARLYLDVLDAIESETAQRFGGIERDAAISLVERIVEEHGDVPLEETEDSAGTLREKARSVVKYLTKAGWLEEEQLSDWRRLVFFDPNGSVLLNALRKIAQPQNASFSDKLVNVCVTLKNRDAIERDPWPQIESCTDFLKHGLAELRMMQKSIERHIRLQLAASTLKESMAVLFDQFLPKIGRACYAQLVHAHLPTRIQDAKDAIDEIKQDVSLLAKMQTELMHREPSLTASAAMSRVRLRLNEVADLLDQIVPSAEAVDRRTADFTRRSLARFRYLQEVTGENRRRVQGFIAGINRLFAGQRIKDIEDTAIDLPELRLIDARQIAGLESLYAPRLRRAVGEIEPVEGELTEEQRERCLKELKTELRGALTANRANRFVATLPESLGSRISSKDIPVSNEMALADMLACLLHAHSADAHFQIEVPRIERDDDKREWDSKLNYRFERFTLVKK